MNSTPCPTFIASGILILAGGSLLSGAEPPAQTGRNQAGDAAPTSEAVELSPFVVSEGQDTGYVAQDTLSGTRTRTPLKDVAGAVGVFTRDFIDDLAATTENDIVKYSASVVPETSDQTANGRGNSLATPETFNYRIRGQAATRTRNFFGHEPLPLRAGFAGLQSWQPSP